MVWKPYDNNKSQMNNHEDVTKIKKKRMKLDWRNREIFTDFYKEYSEEFPENSI